jgi:hypothetical protein
MATVHDEDTGILERRAARNEEQERVASAARAPMAPPSPDFVMHHFLGPLPWPTETARTEETAGRPALRQKPKSKRERRELRRTQQKE